MRLAKLLIRLLTGEIAHHPESSGRGLRAVLNDIRAYLPNIRP